MHSRDCGGPFLASEAFDDFGTPVEVCLVGDGRAFQKLVAGDGGLGRFAIADCEARDGAFKSLSPVMVGSGVSLSPIVRPATVKVASSPGRRPLSDFSLRTPFTVT